MTPPTTPEHDAAGHAEALTAVSGMSVAIDKNQRR
jgi:hypothetical protein